MTLSRETKVDEEVAIDADLKRLENLRFSSGDGTEDVKTIDEERYLAWLKENGAVFPKIDWPCRTTVNSVRGAVALEDIAPNEKMIQIPRKLMMIPENCRASKKIGHVFADYSIFRYGVGGCELLAVFLMHERSIGNESFWAPYIQTLPYPGTVSDWSSEEIDELYDPTISQEAKNYTLQIEAQWKSLSLRLKENFPKDFPDVPFADNLNHSNVSTKYDYNVEDNDNKYPKGCEVFNSYGYRDNRHLLLHYGFSMQNNMWEKVVMRIQLRDDCPGYKYRINLLRVIGLLAVDSIQLTQNRFSWRMLLFHRIAVLSEEDIKLLMQRNDFSRANIAVVPLFSDKDFKSKEIDALLALLSHYNSYMKSNFPTNDSEDTTRFHSSKDPRQKMAIIYRSTRRNLIQYQIERIHMMLAVAEAKYQENATVVDTLQKNVATTKIAEEIATANIWLGYMK